ncbi:Gfo/Idh/MocA family protein [Amaricoccus tamworthensis]|uniref:Gfo/Idh/MocA family protein n=1 Tax=Amaricoccus tamworthensis TaxID=57002 RepID=UPI003C7DD4D0
MGTSDKIHIAVVGAGLIGKRHIEVIQSLENVELDSIVDPTAAALKIALSLDVPHYETVADLLESRRPDGIIIATPNQLHVEHGLQCINKGIPILIEKPLATSSDDAEQLVTKAEDSGVPVLVGHHRRHNPLIQRAKKEIESGGIGPVVAVNAQCWFYKPDEYYEVEWRTKAGAGPVFINLIHDIDLLRYLCGEIESVIAVTSNRTRHLEVEDTAAIVLQFRSGALGTVSVSDTIVAPWSWEMTSRENPVYPPTNEACYRIGGTEGAISIPQNIIWHYANQRSWWLPIRERAIEQDSCGDPLVLQINHFVRVIRGTESPLVSGREGLMTLRVIEAINRSAVSERRARIEQ